VSDGRAYPRAYTHPEPSAPNRAATAESRRSNAAIPVVVVLVVLGLFLGQYTFLFPAAFGLALLYSGGSFLSTRLNPLSPHFYLPKKPSWLAIGVVFLGAIGLCYYAYTVLLRELGGVVPHL
jgi:hypothetical protein